ncbi:virulence factor MVIN-like protein [Thermobifida fusca TM51]|uniref:Probable lipid II flippase MurJ n=1 Tax=Thermobifida fusca TM51 TaxID=1169414 RepID=A0A9P2TDM8_THEFU|nr:MULTISPECIES: murein biosynthesis integral membrane protein MurJ [Thermobifida]EOR72848.1 virulence factor MVIN-like protein [Thermobifida fusca TM51]MDD6792115.1 murein biosynthesis integral membrane protein MurJ [Thermobifida fusca]PPS94254.1 virulence factor MviN [Thermobifida fusca]
MATDISSASDDHTGGPAKDAGSPSPHADSAAPQAEQDSTATPGGMMRSSMVMAVGTMVSRVTGFFRTVVLAAALGTQLLGDAYNVANTIPFIINDLLIGGLMASVIVPFLVRRRKRDADGGKATEDRLFTSAVLVLLVVTVAAILLARPLIQLYASDFLPAQAEVSVYLARFLLAQVFFVGMSGLISAMLNTRGKFGAPVWAPVLNNLVIIAVGVLFLMVGTGSTVETVTTADKILLGAGTSCGMVLQTVVLLGSLWRSGYRWRPRLDLRGSGLGEALRTAGWMFLYTLTTQLGFVITSQIATGANVAANAHGSADAGAGLTAYSYAYQLFQLPYAIIAVSLITVLLPQMSAFAADQRWDEVRAGFSRTLRVSALILVPLSLAISLYATEITVLLFAHGNTGDSDAANIGYILMVMSLGLLPFSVFQLMLRVFYALGDTRTPAFLGIANIAVHGVLALTASWLLPPHFVVVGVAGGFMSSFLVGVFLGGLILRRRLGGLDGRRIASTLVRLYLATAPSVVVGWGVLVLFQSWFVSGLAVNIGAPVVGCLAGLPVFLVAAKLLRIDELSAVMELVKSRLRR